MNQTCKTPCLDVNERVDTVNENIKLIQKKNGLTFGSDAYLLAAFVRPDKGALCVDLGSGTGIIPLLLANEIRSRKRSVWRCRRSLPS